VSAAYLKAVLGFVGRSRAASAAYLHRTREDIVSELTLIPKEFQRLDSIAKAKAGTPIYCVDSMPGGGVRYTGVPIPVCVFPRMDLLTTRHIPCITLASRIDNVEQICSTSASPELDRGRLPKELVFDYLVHHVIGHIVGGDYKIIRHFAKVKWPRELMNGLHDCLNMRADRYAWAEICPGGNMPVRPDNGGIIDRFDEFLQRHHDELQRHRPTIKPLPTAPGTFVPVWNLTLPLPATQEQEQRRVNPLRGIWKRVTLARN
jgi:hypothetical protein